MAYRSVPPGVPADYVAQVGDVIRFEDDPVNLDLLDASDDAFVGRCHLLARADDPELKTRVWPSPRLEFVREWINEVGNTCHEFRLVK